MKNKGFSLIELLAVITILAIIITIVSPNIINLITDSRQSTSNEQKNTIIAAAKRWGADNAYLIKEEIQEKGKKQISVKNLQQEGYLSNKKEIKNPTDSKVMNGCIEITSDGVSYTYKYKESC